jgi:hypothetical protein
MNLNSNNSNDFLLENLTELAAEFEKHDIPLIVVGGFSIYIKTKFMNKARSSRYSTIPFARSTKDIDIFLTSELIIDSAKIENIKTILSNLNFEVKTEYFQFIKKVTETKEVQIDFLSQPVPEHDSDKVKFNKPRIKPKNVKNFHAFYHKEAETISSNLIKVEDLVAPNLKNKFRNVFLPSSFSFIILKLHAFRDRMNKEENDYGRHHAYDIFTAIIEMDETDWNNSKSMYELFKDNPAVSESIKIITDLFISDSQMGIIRLKENQNYKRDKTELDTYIKNFIEDLKEMFNIH